MSLTSGSPAISGGGANLYSAWQQWWETTSHATRTRVQLATFMVLTIFAYHYSLSTLIANLNLSTPLAYIGLVPAIALGLGAAKSRPAAGEPSVTDRQLDYIVGVPLLASAMAINLLLPGRLSAMFWVWRVDLFSFPLFVGGAVALLFGTRALLRQKLAISYLLLAWPLPYSLFLLQVLNGFTNLTISALQHLVNVLHVAKSIPGSDNSLFQVIHNGRAFPLSVVSACSGVDSVVGFLLVGSAFAALVRGPRVRKTLWLVLGMFLLWAINVGRIMFIFWAGKTWGEHVAINILHPFVGLVTFSLGVVLMMLAMPLIGLRLALGESLAPATAARRALPVVRILPAVGLLLVVSAVLAVNNSSLKSYDIVADSSGEPKLASYSAHPASPAGWQANYQTEYTWAQPYFGENSTWLRYLYSSTGQGGDLHASLPITADVINTTNLTSFSAYGVQACYNFHGYSIKDVASAKLTGGITGQSLSYATGSNGTWTIVYWIMPVKPVKSGGSTHYERVILYLQDTPETQVSLTAGLTTAGIHSLQGALDPYNSQDQRLIRDRTFMVHFADEVITAQSKLGVGTPAAGTQPAPSTVADPGATSTPSSLSSGASGYYTDPAKGATRYGTVFTAQAPTWVPATYYALPLSVRTAYRAAHPTWFSGG